MRPCAVALAAIVILLPAAASAADAPSLVFRPAGTGLYEFDTGLLRGRLKVDGKYQGVYPLVDVASGADLVHAPGVFSFYRLFSGNTRFGNAARDWPTTTRLLADGAVEVSWPAAPDHPLQIMGVYRWKAVDTLDLYITVRPQRDLPQFELFMSSYFGKGFRASVYLKPEGQGEARFLPVDRTPQSKGGYVMFPRDPKAQEMIQDGRWKVGSNPVDWAIQGWLAAPVAIRRDASQGLTAATMCAPDDCFAMASPWNPDRPDGGGYRSIYWSLFGRDLKAEQAAQAKCRLVIARDLSDVQVLRRYKDFTAPAKP